jgi:RES domain-containing protein
VSVGLLVPGVIIPQESNCLLNPAHPDFSLDWVEGPLDFALDPRSQAEEREAEAGRKL